MKKLVILLIFVLSAGMLLADDMAAPQAVSPSTAAAAQPAVTPAAAPVAKEKTIIVYDPVRHAETASTVFMTWGALSLGGGVIASTSSDGLGRGIGVGSIVYGIVETTLAIININWGNNTSDPEKARLKLIDDGGWHAWTGLAHLVAGAALVAFGNSDMKGVGVAMALQGSFISISNVMNYSIAKDPKNIRDWNAGIEVRYPLLSAAF